ncbi:MAG: PAS domain-containing protein [Thermoanaerobaculia bacterium]
MLTDARTGLSDSGGVLEAVIDGSPDAIVVVDASGRIALLNTAFARYSARVFGSAPEPLRPLQSLIARAETDRIREFWTAFLERALGGSRVVADSSYTIEGQKRAFLISSTPVAPGEAFAGAAIVVRDITESRAKVRSDSLELNLLHVFSDDRSLEENLHHALEFLCEADAWDFAIAWMFDDDVLVPKAFSRDTTPEAIAFEAAVRELRFGPGHGIPGRALREDAVVWVADLTDETGAVRSRLAAELGFRGVVAVPVRDQGRSLGILEFFTRAIRPMDHDVASALDDIGSAVGRMIERRRSDDERRRLHALIERKGNEWAHTFDAIELPVFLATSAGVITQSNRAACALAGADYDDTVGRALSSLGDGELWRTLGDVIRAVSESRTTCTAESVGGERRWDISGSLYAADDTDDDRVIVVLRDVTTLMALRDSVRRGEQLAALGELVAGVAHEVRNPLFGMSATLFAYEPQLKDNPDAVEMIASLRSWIGRLNTLMESLLEYGKTWSVNLEAGNLDEVVDRAIGECAPLASASRVRIRKSGVQATPRCSWTARGLRMRSRT